MNNKMKECIVICHGKSEVSIMTFIKQAYRLPIKIKSKNGGENSIQITSLLRYLNRREYKSQKNFLEKFKLDKITNNTKIYTIMDTDDCNKEQFQNYINGSMFKNHPLKKCIIPIFNDINLEDVVKRANLEVYKEKSEAFRIFPFSNNNLNYTKNSSIEYVYERLKNDNRTNLDQLILYCMENKTQFK
ncbi:hypothetical protein [Staphylococcus hominis]|uniref:hypothetical protein n=1 Tax=Staphylococcus hominis TaxID=1290 RepID=UPI001F5A6394|nr:hypothetical protein [Staphylococcus hominis]MCI2913685.1 hypothetical protein [Staphylococcus hominis]